MLESTQSMTATQAALIHARCPLCNSHSFELRLHCEMGSGCSYGAVCAHCELRFDLRGSSLPARYSRMLDNLQCPSCHERGGRVSIACTLASRSCEPVILCRHCDYDFTK